MFTIVKKLIYIDKKKHNTMKNIKLKEWIAAGKYMSNINKRGRKSKWSDDNYDHNNNNDNNNS